MTTTRRLAAILAADVVGYSRLMEQDEAGTLAALKDRRKRILAPLVSEHEGRIVKVMGDGVLVEFASAVNAVACAVELQKKMAAANDGAGGRPAHRAAHRHQPGRRGRRGRRPLRRRRHHRRAPAGDGRSRVAFAFPESVHEQVGSKLPLAFEDLGSCEVKNIAKAVQVIRIAMDAPRVGAPWGAARRNNPRPPSRSYRSQT